MLKLNQTPRIKVAFLCVAFSVICALIFYASFTWNTKYPSGDWRYKVTVTIDTPEGIKSGSAVRRVSAKIRPSLLSNLNSFVRVSGEAVIVDLGDRGVLFALLNSPNDQNQAYSTVFDAFPSGGGPPLTPGGIRYYSDLKDVRAVLPLNAYPTLVTFANLADPTSIKVIHDTWCLPDGAADTAKIDRCPALEAAQSNLEGYFGDGVTLRSITITMTNEPVDKKIERYLPWIANGYPEKRILGNVNPRDFSLEAQINYGFFTNEWSSQALALEADFR